MKPGSSSGNIHADTQNGSSHGFVTTSGSNGLKMERALLVTVDVSSRHDSYGTGWKADERSAELKDLAESSGALVIHEEIVKRRTISPALFIGKGKAEELHTACVDKSVEIIIINNDLTGSQQKNLEEITGINISIPFN